MRWLIVVWFSFPLIYRTISQAFFTVMRRLLRPERKFCQKLFLASLIVLRVFDLVSLTLSRLSVVGLFENSFSEFFLLLIAALHVSSNQGFLVVLVELGFVLVVVFSVTCKPQQSSEIADDIFLLITNFFVTFKPQLSSETNFCPCLATVLRNSWGLFLLKIITNFFRDLQTATVLKNSWWLFFFPHQLFFRDYPKKSRPVQRPVHWFFHQVIWPALHWCSAAPG